VIKRIASALAWLMLFAAAAAGIAIYRRADMQVALQTLWDLCGVR
jgi:hypothetical protein